MTSLSCLTKTQTPLVIDASVAINLNATGNADGILAALPNTLLVTDVVLDELRADPREENNDGVKLERLISRGIIQLKKVSDLRGIVFESLVIGSGSGTLDDGEAATIALAVELGAAAVLDERKGHKICARQFSSRIAGCTVDIFAHPSVEEELGRLILADYVYNALQLARMRVFPHHMNWVVSLIGAERARMCPSLPRAVREA